MRTVVAFAFSAALGSSAFGQADELDGAALVFRSGAFDSKVTVSKLWTCFGQSATKSAIVEQTELEKADPTAGRNLRIILQNSEGHQIQLYFTVNKNIAILYKLAMGALVVRKPEAIEGLVEEVCGFTHTLN